MQGNDFDIRCGEIRITKSISQSGSWSTLSTDVLSFCATRMGCLMQIMERCNIIMVAISEPDSKSSLDRH